MHVQALIVTTLLLFSSLGSFIAELYFGYIPCRLCYWQRYLCLSAFSTSLSILLIGYNIKIANLLKAFLILNILIAIYHNLIIYGLINDFCVVNYDSKTIENFWNSLQKKTTCASEEFTFLGLNAPLTNIMMSSLSLFGLYKIKDRKILNEKIKVTPKHCKNVTLQ